MLTVVVYTNKLYASNIEREREIRMPYGMARYRKHRRNVKHWHNSHWQFETVRTNFYVSQFRNSQTPRHTYRIVAHGLRLHGCSQHHIRINRSITFQFMCTLHDQLITEECQKDTAICARWLNEKGKLHQPYSLTFYSFVSLCGAAQFCAGWKSTNENWMNVSNCLHIDASQGMMFFLSICATRCRCVRFLSLIDAYLKW